MPGPWPDLYSLHSLAKDIKSVFPYTTQPPPKVQIGNSLMHIKLVPTLFLTLLLSSTKPAVDFKQY